MQHETASEGNTLRLFIDFYVSIPGVLIINGPQREGKSTLIDYIMFMYRDRFHYGMGMLQTAFRPENLAFIPPPFRHTGWDEEIAKNFLQTRRDLLQQGVDVKLFPAYWIIDDMMSDSAMWGSCDLRTSVLTSRTLRDIYYNLFTISTTNTIHYEGTKFTSGYISFKRKINQTSSFRCLWRRIRLFRTV